VLYNVITRYAKRRYGLRPDPERFSDERVPEFFDYEISNPDCPAAN
jgi:hypothetical protein